MDHSRDDGFSDLQLTRKQTVFLLVASMVVVSVAFITGVLVGRGVKGAVPPALYSESAVTDVPVPDDLPPPPPVQTGNAQSADGIVKEAVTYPDRLTQPAPASESLSETPAVRNEALPQEAAAEVASVSGTADASRESGAPSTTGGTAKSSATASTAQPPSAATAFAEPAGTGMAVQVSAYRNRREAEAMAGRLTSKGYAAYVLAPAPGAPNLFRVRIGKFSTRADAERVVTRLKREERLDPWIVR
jgi:DedD protein